MGHKNSTKSNFLILFAIVSIATSLFSTSRAIAQGNLLITPKRVVFEGQKGTQEINLANTGNDTARYVVSFIQIRMKKDGGFEEIQQPDSGQYFADKYLRIFPRQVTLAPKEAQVVKLQLSQANKLTPGEYRSHLYFRAPADDKSKGSNGSTEASGLSVRLSPVFGISIPVIIRSGETSAGVSISNLRLDASAASTPKLSVSLNRTGNRSVYGDIKVEHLSINGKVTVVALMRGISVYTPNSQRDLNLVLDNKAGINYKAGKLRVTYSTPPDEKLQQLAEAEFALK